MVAPWPVLAHGVARPPKGAEVEVHIERLDVRGRGVGEIDGYPVRARGALPGQTVRVRISRRRRGTMDGHVLERVEQSPDAVPPRCDHVGVCGGCAFQDYAYPAQLRGLRDQVAAAFAGVGLEIEVPAVVGCDPPFGYRNKMEFTFSNRRWIEVSEPEGAPRDFALGLHITGRYDKVLDIRGCALHFPGADALLASARQVARELELTPWDVHQHEGLLRHLVLRHGFATAETMVNLVTSEDATEAVDAWSHAMCERHPAITTVVQNVNTRPASIAVGERERLIHGPGTITEIIGGTQFVISANSFFQTNSRQAEVLFRTIAEAAAPAGDETVWDLYCGTGALSLVVAGRARSVTGFELVPSAVTDARRNAELNGLDNVTFLEGDVLETLQSGGNVDGIGKPDLCLVDPPRAGLHPKVLDGLLELAPPRIVWVSCNIHAAAPQLARLVAAGGYRIERVQPADMFPHTPHVEVVVSLTRSDTR